MDLIVLNYLVIEGYKSTAEKFIKETGLSSNIELAAIEERMRIRSAIQAGHIDEAINLVNALNPEVLDCSPELFFHLHQQKVIEFIRSGDIQSALDHTQEELAPRGEENAEFLAGIEKTMTLFLMGPGIKLPSELADLLDPLHRVRTANEINAAILSFQCQEKGTPLFPPRIIADFSLDSKLPKLVRLALESEKSLDLFSKFPHIADLTTVELADPEVLK